MSLEAYQKTQQATETASQTEYRIFTQVTRALMDARELPTTDKRLHEALHWNRRLWSTLATDCAVEGNKLPDILRGQIVSLSIWVSKYSSQVAKGEENVDALITINRNIMDGLAAQASLSSSGAAREESAGAPTQPFTSTTI
ncbi:flagellar biosynthesis regulator FlaF [Emcibacter nanhaiensis]|uniref:Flagellar biosynthesis regulator FlaF n=1 Tax=Emcibacter nanhaiensis TaxID=1505037 RepID=A0A501PRS0_9PROT|nr:flagellar biosynthesis regulator FlaF [Emcibacter nanhaiensis]TPD62817.1 flagellar biosynthesis regulator FlaF [Emcibacter nanhaiensis]